MSAEKICFLVIALLVLFKGDAKMKTVVFNTDVSTPERIVSTTTFAVAL